MPEIIYRNININQIETNRGQIDGLPKNPRFIRDDKFEKLKQSIKDFPEMLELREVVVFPFKDKYVVVGGNMRYLSCKDLGLAEIPAKVLPVDFPIEKLAEFAIKDNASFGENDWDLIANEWTDFPLDDWGLNFLPPPDLDDLFVENPEEVEEKHSLVLHYTEDEFNTVKTELLKHGQSYESAVWNLLGI